MLNTFTSANSDYTVEVLGFGLMEVTRVDSHGFEMSLVVDDILCVPAREGGDILVDRVVAFRKDGEVLLRTGYTGSDTYCNLVWGSWEDGQLAFEKEHRARRARRLPAHLQEAQVVMA